MSILEQFYSLSAVKQDFYLTIGNYDGLHKGHQIILQATCSIALENDAVPVVLTFVKKPSLVYNDRQKIKNIFPVEDKVNMLKEIGFKYVILQDFSEEFFNLSREEFASLMFSHPNFKGLIVGENFKFGKDRKGDTKYLNDLFKKENKFIKIIPLYFCNGIYISSTYIRERIEKGDMEVNKFLFYPFYIKGVVEGGKKLGRTIGYPTTNVYIYDQITPLPGVYFSFVYILHKERFFYGMTYIGANYQVETHIFDFNEDVYGKTIKVFFIERIRENKQIKDVTELKILLDNDRKYIYDKYIHETEPQDMFRKIREARDVSCKPGINGHS